MTEQPRADLAGPSDLSIEGMTSPATLLLATPLLLQRALALFACTWEPKTPDVGELSTRPGVYAWVVAPHGTATPELLRRPAIYWGKGASLAGVVKRLIDEATWAAEHPLIGHGLAMARTGAQPVVGEVHVDPDGDDLWRQLLPSVPAVALEQAELKLAAFNRGLRAPESVIAYSERFAIRVALCAGDVAPPVNSQFAGAWELPEDGATDLADVAAWYAVRHLAGGVRGWTRADGAS